MANAVMTRWVAIGLLGLPLHGALTLWSSIDPQPDPKTQYDAWARFVTTDYYVIGHLLGSGLGLVAGIFGSFALGAALAATRAKNQGLAGMVLAVAGAAIFLLPMGVSTFAAPWEGFAYLSSGERLPDLTSSLASQLMSVTILVAVVLSFVGNVLLGVGVWRSHLLPRWSGAIWAAAPILMYPLGLVYAIVVGVQSTPPTVPLGAAAMVISGSWIAWRASQVPGYY